MDSTLLHHGVSLFNERQPVFTASSFNILPPELVRHVLSQLSVQQLWKMLRVNRIIHDVALYMLNRKLKHAFEMEGWFVVMQTQSISPLFCALEHNLRFVGLYSHIDRATYKISFNLHLLPDPYLLAHGKPASKFALWPDDHDGFINLTTYFVRQTSHPSSGEATISTMIEVEDRLLLNVCTSKAGGQYQEDFETANGEVRVKTKVGVGFTVTQAAKGHFVDFQRCLFGGEAVFRCKEVWN